MGYAIPFSAADWTYGGRATGWFMIHKLSQQEKLSPTEVKVNSLVRQLLLLSKGFALGNIEKRMHTGETLGASAVMSESRFKVNKSCVYTQAKELKKNNINDNRVTQES